jgi:hypothetical protein
MQLKGANKNQIPRFELFYLFLILMHFILQNDHLYGLLIDHKQILLFISKRGLKGAKIKKLHIFGRYI